MTERWRVTLLSAVVPGWGQFELGDARAGRWFLGASVLLLALFIGAALVGTGARLAAVALLELNAWASVHAWFAAARQRRA